MFEIRTEYNKNKRQNRKTVLQLKKLSSKDDKIRQPSKQTFVFKPNGTCEAVRRHNALHGLLINNQFPHMHTTFIPQKERKQIKLKN